MIWNAMSIFPGWSAVMNDSVPWKFCLYELIGTSLSAPIGMLNRVAETMYLVFGVVNGDACPPAALGIWRISSVSKRVRSIRATRGVLLALMKSQRPSG